MTDPIAPEHIVQCLPTISSTLILGAYSSPPFASTPTETNHSSPKLTHNCYHFCRLHRHLGEQEDAHEFLRCMVDALQRSIPLETRKRKEQYPFSLFTGSVKNTVKCLKCKKTSCRIGECMSTTSLSRHNFFCTNFKRVKRNSCPPYPSHRSRRRP